MKRYIAVCELKVLNAHLGRAFRATGQQYGWTMRALLGATTVQHHKLVFTGRFENASVARDGIYCTVVVAKSLTGPLSRNVDLLEVHERGETLGYGIHPLGRSCWAPVNFFKHEDLTPDEIDETFAMAEAR